MSENAESHPREFTNAPKEPWPVWRGCPSNISVHRFTVCLPFALVSALVAVVFWIEAIGQGHTHIPILLFWIHSPLMVWVLQIGNDLGFKEFLGKENAALTGNKSPEAIIRTALVSEAEEAAGARYSPPDVGNDYRVKGPVLFGDDGLENLQRPILPWSAFERYEYTGEYGGAFAIRLVFKADSAAAIKARKREIRDRFRAIRRRLALALPGIVTLWIFVSALEQHGWRADTVAAFFAALAHVLTRLAFRTVSEPRPESSVHLIFDSRVVTPEEAFSRLSRYLQGPGEAA